MIVRAERSEKAGSAGLFSSKTLNQRQLHNPRSEPALLYAALSWLLAGLVLT